MTAMAVAGQGTGDAPPLSPAQNAAHPGRTSSICPPEPTLRWRASENVGKREVPHRGTP